MKCRFLVPALLALLPALPLALPPSLALAAPPRPAADVETRITSDKLSYVAEKRQVIFEGNVQVKRPDFELSSARLTVSMKAPQDGEKKTDPGPAGLATGDVDRLVASGNVVMREPKGRHGTCQSATYIADTGVLLMEGNPRLTDGKNSITGDRIRYYTRENRSEVLSGNNKRVEAVFTRVKKGN